MVSMKFFDAVLSAVIRAPCIEPVLSSTSSASIEVGRVSEASATELTLTSSVLIPITRSSAVSTAALSVTVAVITSSSSVTAMVGAASAAPV